MAATGRLGGVRRDKVPATTRAPIEGEAILQHLEDFIDTFIWQADAQTLEITFATKSAFDVTGLPSDEWTGPVRRWLSHTYPGDRGPVESALRAVAGNGVDREIDCRVMTPAGTERHLRHVVRRIESPSGEHELWGLTIDRTSEIQTEEALEETRVRYHRLSEEADEFRRRSLSDPLTDLPNRALFSDRLAVALRAAERNGTDTAVFLIDLDRFKELNDTLGHAAGDAALKGFALRLRICLRGQDTPSRIGGDEFAAVLPDTDAAGAVRVAERLVGSLRDAVPVGEHEATLGASIGIAVAAGGTTTVEEILAAADAAMYYAKKNGGGVALAGPRVTVDDITIETVTTQPPRTPRRSVRRIVTGIVAIAAVLGGAAVPLAHRVTGSRDPVRALTAATAELRQPDGDVTTVVDSVESVLERISLKDVSADEVASALAELATELRSIRPDVRVELADRIDRLLATIDTTRTLVDRTVRTARDEEAAKAVPLPKPTPAQAPAPIATPAASSASAAPPSVPAITRRSLP